MTFLKRRMLPIAMGLATCVAMPAVSAQSLGAGVNAGGVARVGTPVASMQSQAGLHGGVHANPQVATPGVPATPTVPATPAVPAVKPEAATDGAMQAATPAVPATPATPATPAKKGWSELDANGNGSLSTTEAASMESLARVFAKADADANGELTQDEYRAWLAANAKARGKANTGG